MSELTLIADDQDKPFAGKRFIFAAGGTGGHVFPAESLAHALVTLGGEVYLLTDKRGEAFAKRFPGYVHVIPSAPWKTTPKALLQLGVALVLGFWKCFKLLLKLKPACVIAFGGYPTIPPTCVAQLMRIPTLIHEQNAVLGRANRLLGHFARGIALGLPMDLQDHPELNAKAHLVGTPVRTAVMQCVGQAYPMRDVKDPLNLVVFGGSQGARIFADVLPPACGMLALEERALLHITQQVREEDYERVSQQYKALGIHVNLAPFFGDLPTKIANAHLVIGRAGASTVAELSALGRPSILVPLPHAVDQDQANNAQSLQTVGAAIVVPQSKFTPQALAVYFRQALTTPDSLTKMAAAAHAQARLNAVEALCILVKDVICTDQKRPTKRRKTNESS